VGRDKVPFHRFPVGARAEQDCETCALDEHNNSIRQTAQSDQEKPTHSPAKEPAKSDDATLHKRLAEVEMSPAQGGGPGALPTYKGEQSRPITEASREYSSPAARPRDRNGHETRPDSVGLDCTGVAERARESGRREQFPQEKERGSPGMHVIRVSLEGPLDVQLKIGMVTATRADRLVSPKASYLWPILKIGELMTMRVFLTVSWPLLCLASISLSLVSSTGLTPGFHFTMNSRHSGE
jgi:hypothetical protein